MLLLSLLGTDVSPMPQMLALAAWSGSRAHCLVATGLWSAQEAGGLCRRMREVKGRDIGCSEWEGVKDKRVHTH